MKFLIKIRLKITIKNILENYVTDFFISIYLKKQIKWSTFYMKNINMEDDEIKFNYNVLKNYEIASCIQKSMSFNKP